MNYKHKDRVKIKKGFHSGVSATVLGVRRSWFFIKEYEVVFNWFDAEGTGWNTRTWMKGSHLSSTKYKKEGNVLIGDFKKKRFNL